ncbi:hypothetical protein PFISCL1PPCAC_840, partial [Pristionchus fissidentatus]
QSPIIGVIHLPIPPIDLKCRSSFEMWNECPTTCERRCGPPISCNRPLPLLIPRPRPPPCPPPRCECKPTFCRNSRNRCIAIRIPPIIAQIHRESPKVQNQAPIRPIDTGDVSRPCPPHAHWEGCFRCEGTCS